MITTNLLFIYGTISAAMFILYWYLIFELADTIIENPKLSRLQRIPVGLLNTAIVAGVSTAMGGSVVVYITIFMLILLNFKIFYKDEFGKCFFCASACIVHVMALYSITISAYSMLSGRSVYELSREYLSLVLTIAISFAIINIAILAVLKLISSSKLKTVNQHREQQWFIIAWMTVFNLYMLYNSDIFNEPIVTSNLAITQFITPIIILLGLYIVLFFSFKTSTLLGYKDKNAELEQAVFQEQQYRNAAIKDAIATYEVNVTQDFIMKGFEEKRDELGKMAYNYSDMLTYMTRKIIHSEDIGEFTRYATLQNITREFDAGKGETTAEYRRLLENGEYKWVRAVTNLVKDVETGDLLAYVCIKDIDAEKRHRLELEYKAERDPLTGLYNKEITGKLVNEYLTFSRDHSGTLFMIDVDNFKGVNDGLSHVFGDAVLCELADKLRKIFRHDDIVGRIGGDEFIAYMKNYAPTEKVEEKAAEICEAFHITYKGKSGEEYTISASVGIALSPKDGYTFEDLYKFSDVGLYGAKRKGKNTYAFYNGGDFSGYTSSRTEIELLGLTEQKGFRQNRIEYVFKMLYQSDNSVEAIHAVLELVASHFSFERGYIFETGKDGKTTSNTFEWCASGVKPEIDNLQNVPIEVVATANSHFYNNGTFILRSIDDLQPVEREILEPQGIKAMFQFGIFDKNQLLGFIGFDNCRSESVPSDMDVDEMTTVCNILATFFVKQHLDKKSESNLLLFQDVMNHLDNYIYVINMQNFEVLFMNQKTKTIMKEFESTTPCYHFFRGNQSQCEDCPLKLMDNNDISQKAVQEIYNNKLDIWIETTATPLRWQDGSVAVLINCADITKQKEQHLLHIGQLEKLAYVDELTGGRTYNKFKEDLRNILEKENTIPHALIKLDIDNFKLINQIYGYEKGDEILCSVSKAMEKTARNDSEIFARISNDEFIILLPFKNVVELTDTYELFIEHFYETLGEQFTFKMNFPRGLYVVKAGELEKTKIVEMLEKVNVAHKAAKQDKSARFVLYDENITKVALHQKQIESKMEKALRDEDFIVYLQPKYYLSGEKIGGAEALVRWKNEEGDMFLPGAFIPVFEKNGFIIKMDMYMLRKVCGIIRSWMDEGIEPIVVSVNFSRLHLSNREFVKELSQIVDSFNIERKYIEIEITETVIYDNIETLENLIVELHEAGFTMSMDDFGSGYSSLGMLQNLPVDIIKMDRSFFANQKDAKRSKAVVGSVIHMAASLGIGIVAEGVEEKEHIELLKELKCDMVQGYYFARPMPVSEFKQLMELRKTQRRTMDEDDQK